MVGTKHTSDRPPRRAERAACDSDRCFAPATRTIGQWPSLVTVTAATTDAALLPRASPADPAAAEDVSGSCCGIPGTTDGAACCQPTGSANQRALTRVTQAVSVTNV